MQMFPESSSLQEGCWIIKAPGTKQLQRGRDEVCVSEKSFHCMLGLNYAGYGIHGLTKCLSGKGVCGRCVAET